MASDLTPEQRVLRSRMGAHRSWANTEDRAARTAPARKAFMDRFERQVDPEGKLPPAERAQRAEHAKSAHMAELAYRSSLARSRKKVS